MKAILSNYRQSPRKVRLVAGLVKGKQVALAIRELDVLTKRASLPLKKLIESAVANARHNGDIAAEDLVVKSMRVDKGVTMKRSMPRARGSASRINKRASNIVLELGLAGKGALPAGKAMKPSKEAPAKKSAVAKKATKKAAK